MILREALGGVLASVVAGFVAAGFVAAAAQAGMSPASTPGMTTGFELAANGCGYGFHRTASGRCDNVRDYNAFCQPGFHKVPTPSTASGFRCVQNGY
jgi:hypothetical protein